MIPRSGEPGNSLRSVAIIALLALPAGVIGAESAGDGGSIGAAGDATARPSSSAAVEKPRGANAHSKRSLKRPVKRETATDAGSKNPARINVAKKGQAATAAAQADPVERRREACREKIESTSVPAQIVRIAEECSGLATGSEFGAGMRRLAESARRVVDAQHSAGLSTDLFEGAKGNPPVRELMYRIARGDMEAAYLLAQLHKPEANVVATSSRRMEQWLRVAAELGHGKASWELAEYYNYRGMVADAARFERKSVELGFQPGVRLPSRGY